MDPDIRDIAIVGLDGAESTVTAGCYGPVAVHRDNCVGPNYTITHLATGMAAVKGLNRSAAIVAAERLATDAAWQFRTLDEFEQNKSRLRALLDAAIRAAGTMPQRKAS